MDKAGSPWCVPVAVEDIPEGGLHMDIAATPEIRAAVAALAGLRDLSALTADFELVRRGAGVRVSGSIEAIVRQTCVVTLDPIENKIEEPIDVLFMPAAQAPAASPGSAAEHDGEEPPEPLIGGKVDLGALAVEFILLGIDPYPRKPGAEFVPPKTADSGNRPFAGLAALKKQFGDGPA